MYTDEEYEAFQQELLAELELDLIREFNDHKDCE